MTNFRDAARFASVIAAVLAGAMTLSAGEFASNSGASLDELEAPRYQFAAESAYLLGIFNNPHGYEIGAQFLTARIRFAVVENDSWLRGYHQFYFSALAEPIFRGPENYYFGFNMGLRYNFVRAGGRLIPYISGGVGAGLIDAHENIPGAQGQDFTFNILTAAGVEYKLTDRWKLNAGLLYQHLSNAGQTNPNPSLNLLGPQIGVTCSF